MEQSQKQIRKSIIFIIICTITFILLLILTINNYLLYGKYLNDFYELNNKLLLINDKTKNILNINTNLKVQINEINNIDETINKTKEETFSLASQVENKINNKETKYKIAYLTFDDGPYYSTNEVLNILKRYKVKATFFTIGLDKDICYDNKNYSCANTYKKIVDNGHTIANHTYSHAIFRGLYNNNDSFMYQVKLQEELIKNRTGIKTNIIRFPGGSATAKSKSKNYYNTIVNNLKNSGYGWVDWTAQDGDGGYLPTYDIAWNNFTNTINEDIEVVLFHDYSTITISMLPKAIEYLEERDYILLPLFYDSVKVNK